MKLLGEHGISDELRSIIENTNDLMFVKNRDFVYIASSRNYALDCVRCNGVDEVIGKTDFELFEDQEIAARYRADDEKLFASGKTMTEFREEYPDRDGKKHICLTTKYLLHDKEGNPVAIFGQYHDIGKQVELFNSFSSQKTLEAIFDEVPGGIILYEWNGKDLKVLRMSKYYQELYGDSMLNDTESPDFVRIHPDDVADYQAAIQKALTETHHLEYVFRAWTKRLGRYVWTQIDAISEPQADGTSLVYAIYTDITKQKEAELEAAKKQASLEAALNVSNQLCCEYDPQQHSVNCFTENNFFHIPNRLHHYPECLRELDIVHPDDIELFINTVHSADHGKSAHCDVRAKRDGEYRWYACRLAPYFNPEKERNVVILTIVDASVRIASIQSYRDRLHTLEKANEDALCMCDVNLTRNQFSHVQAETIIKRCAEKAGNLDEFMYLASEAVFDPGEQQIYRSMFQRENLLKLFEQGESHIKFEHFYRIDTSNTALVETVFDLIREPITGDVVGICYAKDLNTLRLSSILLNASLDQDYPMAALVYADTGEYYLYEIDRKEYCKHKQNYWNAVHDRLAEAAGAEALSEIRNNLTGERVTAFLENHEEYTYVFYGMYRGKRCRLEAKFRYVDKKHHLILATLRNITDEALYQQYKYNSEHDPLTGLYNRNTFFEKSRELIEEYPDEQFVMLHVDIRHFHLYNTFFGDEAGDRLLCQIAKALNKLAKEYDCVTCGRMEADVFSVCFPVNRGLFEEHVHRSFRALEAFSPDFPLDLAVGAYWITDPSMSMEAMFARATIAAKSHKKNLFDLISRYDEGMDQELRDTQQITSEMTAAIEQEQFQVYLQPKYSLRSDQMIGAEALVRWRHPKRGMISPGKFIPAFEQNGFIANLDRYMWEHVCQILRRWLDEGKTMYPVSVNISRVSMYSHATVPFLESLIEKYRIDPKYLELELTETAYMDDPEDLKRMLKELQEFGFKILMDDFGSGYSSLNTLRELPVDVLKLDMKFLSMSQDDVRGNAVLSSVVRMSKLLNLPIVAEGVETQEQADYLRSIGCEYVQGFLFARPMPTADYENLLNEGETEAEPEDSENAEPVSLAAADVLIEDPFLPLGILEYDKERFAYLRTNKKFLKEFDLIENLKPASRVFRDHLDDASYNILLQAFAACSETKKDSFCSLKWTADDGLERKYHGYVHYHGEIGNYADLAVTFMNVTEINRFEGSDCNDNVELEARVAELERKLSFLGAAIDNMPNPIFMKGSDGRFVYFNQRYAECFGMTREKYIGGTVLDLEYLPEEDRRKYQAEDLRLIKTGEISSYDKNFVFNDGRVHPSFYWSKGFVCPGNGEHGLIGEIVDVSGERKLSNNLVEIIRGTAYMFERIYVVDLENGIYTTIDQKEDSRKDITISAPFTEFFEKAAGRFYDPLNRHLKDYCFSTAGLHELLKDRDDYYFECKDKMTEGAVFSATVYCIERKDGKPAKVLYAIRDITDTKITENEYRNKLKKANEKLKDLANRDVLTGLYNRRGLMEAVRLQLTEDSRVAMLLIDVDRFKTINDSFGHVSGDKLLVKISQLLNSTFRSNDIMARLGGDEFMAILLDCNYEQGKFIPEKIRYINEKLQNPADDTPRGSLSVGIAFSRPGETQKLYNRADAALYRVKERGRCGCCVYEDEFDDD